MTIRTVFPGVLVALATAYAARAQNPPEPACAQLAGSSKAEQLKYLSEDRKSLSSDCIEVAIRRLGVERYAPAVDTLVTYLDFENQSLAHLHQMGLFNNPMIEHSFAYPARAALAEIGVAAIDKLIAVIASESSPRIVSENAAISLTDIVTWRDSDRSSAVATMVTAAKATPDLAAAARLMDTARKIAENCVGAELRSKCELALN